MQPKSNNKKTLMMSSVGLKSIKNKQNCRFISFDITDF